MSTLEGTLAKPLSDLSLPTRLLFVYFEWDDEKSRENLRKHGYDFRDAWEVFETSMLYELDQRMYYGEERWNGIGLLGNRIVVITYTFRHDDTIRIISLRKAVKHERKRLEESITD